MRHLALVVAITITAFTVVVVASGRAVGASAPPGKVSYRPPVAGPIVDDWRPPDERWQAGNRGIDYAPPPGTPVKAAADGEVTFSGQVGGRLHVVVLHPDGIRTTYAFLDSVAVHRSDKVRQGQVVGTAGPDGLHFGARVGDDYIDPRTLFDEGPPQVYLVPDDVRRPGTEAEERRGLTRWLADRAGDLAGRAWGYAVDRVADEVRGRIIDPLYEYAGLAYYAWRLSPAYLLQETLWLGTEYWRQRNDCTPAGVVPPPLPEDRVAVLVAGMGSSSAKDDSLDELPVGALGYVETVRLSYRGGTIDERAYTPRDTTTDIRVVAEHLRDLLAETERRHPGTPIDIIAHSQGGIVAREALAHGYDNADRRLPPVRNIVTLASPHRGADIATGVHMLGHTTVGEAALAAAGASGATPFDPTGPSIEQLSEVSWFLLHLNLSPLPDGVRITSIGARGDLTVPAGNTTVPGGHTVIVDPAGWSDHSRLPKSPEAYREVALAVAGMAPTCQSLGDMVVDHFVSEGISWAEDALSAAAYQGGKRIDRMFEGGRIRDDSDPPRRPPPSSPPPPSPPPSGP